MGGDGGDVVLDKLINDGYAVERTKTGWFTEIKIPTVAGKGVLSYDNRKDILPDMVDSARAKIMEEAKRTAYLRVTEAQKRLLTEKAVCLKKIIEEAVEKYGSKGQPKPVAEIGRQEAGTAEVSGKTEEPERRVEKKRFASKSPKKK
ncbi:MAG: hypothetical protein NT155_01390 [Candidatus Staskawiczbacteria bacterium]|nr:hypothetical protein [Candidatus Staskawiczbacteria bacterium]